uniref:Uncharacterized protein n=1 Tax=Cucumis melo TaxID=3656 RepID=A0A9I9EEL2_CUCME
MDDNFTARLIRHAYSLRKLDMLINSIGFAFRLRTTKTEVYLKIVRLFGNNLERRFQGVDNNHRETLSLELSKSVGLGGG